MAIQKGAQALASDVANGANLPSGVILLWHGTLASIPSGFVLCDGNNGTPNLLDKFVKSVPDGLTDPGTTGGATTHEHAATSYNWPTGSSTTWYKTSPANHLPPYYEVAFIMKT